MRPSVFNTKQHAIVKVEIDKHFAEGAIISPAQEMGEFISTIFLRPKKDGTHRTILNLKEFNEFVAYHHFKMDTLRAAISMMKPSWFMASVDLKDAYYTVPIHPSHRKLLYFCFIIVLPYTQNIHIKLLKKMRQGSPRKPISLVYRTTIKIVKVFVSTAFSINTLVYLAVLPVRLVFL